MRYMVFLFWLALAPLCAHAQETPSSQAPFGLSWGMSTSQVKAMGVELTDAQEVEWGTSFTAAKLPKVLTDANTVFLSFGFNDKLWRIWVSSRPFENDPAGTNVLARYGELSGILADKYGKGKSAHSLGQYNQQQHFAMHIKGGDAQWFTNFNPPQLMIQLGIQAHDYSTTYWILIFEEQTLASEFEKTKKAKERGTL
jgi:hypothetical protein